MKIRIPTNEESLTSVLQPKTKVSESNWSARFEISNLSDFQVGMVCTEEFKDGEAEWYLPSAENGMMRYIRVLITTKDEATLFVSFSDPYKPECMIKNSTPEVLEYKQSGAKRRQVIQPFTSVPFVWDDLVSSKKKQLKIYTNKEKQEFSIDDIKQIGEIKSKTDKYSIFVKAKKDFKQISIRPEQKAKDAGKNAKPINPLQILLMERMSLKRLSIFVEVKGIQVSIIDSDPKEVNFWFLFAFRIN